MQGRSRKNNNPWRQFSLHDLQWICIYKLSIRKTRTWHDMSLSSPPNEGGPISTIRRPARRWQQIDIWTKELWKAVAEHKLLVIINISGYSVHLYIHRVLYFTSTKLNCVQCCCSGRRRLLSSYAILCALVHYYSMKLKLSLVARHPHCNQMQSLQVIDYLRWLHTVYTTQSEYGTVSGRRSSSPI